MISVVLITPFFSPNNRVFLQSYEIVVIITIFYYLFVLHYVYHVEVSLPTCSAWISNLPTTFPFRSQPIVYNNENLLRPNHRGTNFLYDTNKGHKSRLNRVQNRQHDNTILVDDNNAIELSSSALGNDNLQKKLNCRVLIIDHYDSFTYNLADYIGQICRIWPTVIASDCVNQYHELMDIGIDVCQFDCIILSPGPGNPSSNDHKKDKMFRLARCMVEYNPHMPILGVCLGHQILGDYYGANVTLSPEPIHGQIHTIQTDPNVDDILFHNIPSQFNVTRYHSLQVLIDQQENKSCLFPTSYSMKDRVLMSMRHSQYPHWGVQFHPESIGSTPYGITILYNFVHYAYQYTNTKKNDKNRQQQSYQLNQHIAIPSLNSYMISKSYVDKDNMKNRNNQSKEDNFPVFNVYIHKVATNNHNHMLLSMTPSQVMDEFFMKSSYAFWLDGDVPLVSHTSHPEVVNQPPSISDQNNDFTSSAATLENDVTYSSKISIIGGHVDDPSYQLRRIEYWGKEKDLKQQGLYVYENNSCVQHHNNSDILTYLERFHSYITSNVTLITFDDPNMQTYPEGDEQVASQIPFQYRGGHIGFLGYEVRHDTARYQAMMEGGGGDTLWNQNNNDHFATIMSDSSLRNRKVPSAAFLWADRSFVYHHDTSSWYIVGVHTKMRDKNEENEQELQNMLNWMQKVSRTMQRKAAKQRGVKNHYEKYNGLHELPLDASPVAFVAQRSKVTYEKNFDDCMEYIRQGESYELCLTNQINAVIARKGHHTLDPRQRSPPLDLYHILRRRNPAPYSTFIDWNSMNVPSSASHRTQSADATSFAICCSSPERFVSVKRRPMKNENTVEFVRYDVEAKPIKGTCPRVRPKSFAIVKDADHADSNNFSFNSHPKPQWTTEEWIEDQARALALQLSVKNRAENLMIVDLLRNDLSRVCDVGSVHVAKLFGIESFATVHQLVSTIRGTITSQPHPQHERDSTTTDATNTLSTILAESSSPVPSTQVLKALFPGGSMTGAPKVRTMELLDTLEEHKCRGPYSGCLGYISVNGCMDMNIIIRTAVLIPEREHGRGTCSNEATTYWNVNIGTGGAITALSENDDEYEEMILKANPVMKAVEEWAAMDSMLETIDEIDVFQNASSFCHSNYSFSDVSSNSALLNSTAILK